jgi:hypothetical protein
VIAFRCHTSSLLNNTDGQAVRGEVLEKVFGTRRMIVAVRRRADDTLHTKQETFPDLFSLPIAI